MNKEQLIHELESAYPVYYKTCLFLEKTFFYKNIFELHSSIPIDPVLAEKICSDALVVSNNNWDEYTLKIKNLFDLNIQFLKLQNELEKTGKYHFSSFKEIEEYFFEKNSKSDGEGVSYLWGLYFSQIFWVTHHRLFAFFLHNFVSATENKTGACLEIPLGSGIYSNHFLIHNKEWTGTGIDLSKSAIAISKELSVACGVSDRINIQLQDIFLYESVQTFDRIICGELLEHVEDPVSVLKKLSVLLKDNGKVFLTTVAWAAAIDHIYLYKNSTEIRNHIAEAGFKIEKEYIQKVFPGDDDIKESKNIALNYCAILTK